MPESEFDPSITNVEKTNEVKAPELSLVLQEAMSVVPQKYKDSAYSMMGFLGSEESNIDWFDIVQLQESIYNGAPWAAAVAVFVYFKTSNISGSESAIWAGASGILVKLGIVTLENPEQAMRIVTNIVKVISDIV